MPKTTKISYILQFFKSYILVEVDSEHWLYHDTSNSLKIVDIVVVSEYEVNNWMSTEYPCSTSTKEI